ncbi:MAG: hypothetical protein A2Y10_15495 [Planctomycetes bacterium GWF2_41_51]|nr:MAG: hypothetical protein A2Y10_15495 [Planctomycetes bacterium GWF2_41_51]HBG27559.1 hypothetical protein [Phycisphaerales bacterium]
MFLYIILILSFVLNFYVLCRLAGMLAVKRGIIFFAVAVLLSISLIVASMLRHWFDNTITKIIFSIVTYWYGILWLLFSTLIVYEIIKLFIKIKPYNAGIAILLIVAVLTVYSMINTQLIKIKKVSIPGSANIDIAQISDIHIGSVSGWFFKRVISKINDANPDFVLITGDLVDNANGHTRKALEVLKTLNAPVLFVTGNHEGYAGVEKVTEALKSLDVTVLRNQSADFNDVQFIGIDDGVHANELKSIIDGLRDTSKFCILMYHRPPNDLNLLSRTGVNLTLCGHTHKGQIFPFNFVVKNFFKNIYGLYEFPGGNLYVTSGTGTWGPRMRLGSRSEIVLIQIREI